MDETNWQGLPGGLWFFVIYDQQYVTGRYDQQLYWDVTFLVAGFLKLAGLEYAKWISIVISFLKDPCLGGSEWETQLHGDISEPFYHRNMWF